VFLQQCRVNTILFFARQNLIYRIVKNNSDRTDNCPVALTERDGFEHSVDTRTTMVFETTLYNTIRLVCDTDVMTTLQRNNIRTLMYQTQT
jgi:hypothetical protein